MRITLREVILTTLFWLLAVQVNGQIKGYVVDSQTGDSIPYVSAFYKGHQVAVSGNMAGRFEIIRMEGWTLTISAVGYKSKSIKITSKTPKELHVKLVSDSKQLGEVVVKAKRKTKYSRKNNPAVDLMRRVIANKSRTDLGNHDFYSYDKYQKLTMAINNLTPTELEGKMFQKSPWLLQQVEVCPYNQKLILPLSVDETLTRNIYRKDPHKEKEIVLGQTTKGVSKLIQTGGALNEVLKDVFQDIDIYDDHISLLQKRFPSPIGSTAVSFYHFYIDDTVYVDHERCIRLQFLPANQQDFGFRGELYILDDSTLHVKKCDMQLPANTGVNFVDAMKIEQEYTKLANGDWALTTDNMVVELELTDLFRRVIVIRTTKLSDYAFDPIPDKEFKGKAATRYEANAKLRDDAYWDDHRTVELTKSEAEMDNFIQNMSQTKHFKWVMIGVKTVLENFIETGTSKTPSKFDIGPLTSVISTNFVDGLRLRAAGKTTANLSPHWFADGYYAYGFKSKRHYYGTTLTYSFNKKEYQPHEFPTQTITFESYYDVESPADKFLYHNKDNIFMAIRPKKVQDIYFYHRHKLSFNWETDWGMNSSVALKSESDEPTGTLEYKKMDGSIVSKIRMTDMKLSFVYRPGQSYINTKQGRIMVNKDAPEYKLTHTMGFQHFLGGNFSYHLTEASVYKRFWLGSWGKFDVRLMAGAQWSKVPYPLLIMPPVNTSYMEHQGSFNLMENMEFMNDRYALFNLAWDLNGKLFNRIPLLKKLKWREYISLKGMWGHLTDKNNPRLPQNANDDVLYQFPEHTRMMTNDPYMEFVVGIHNILKCLEIDYVRRLTYNHFDGVSKNGVRFGFNLSF